MTLSNRLEVLDDIGLYRLAGAQTFQQALQAVAEAIRSCREQGLRKMLIVCTDTVGFEAPSIVDRHGMVRVLAEAAQGVLRIAMAVPPDFIDGEKFAVVAAANFGLVSNVFSTEAEALDWLRNPH